jgi:signal transduction histidine kinase
MLISIAGAAVLVWHTYRVEDLLASITDRHLAAFQSAEALETALVNQKGFVSYYYLDGDPEWLRQLGEYRQIFKERLQTAKDLAMNPEQRTAVDQIEAEYLHYIEVKDQVIAHYMAGERKAGTALHRRSRDEFFNILNRCEQYKTLHARNISGARQAASQRARSLRAAAYSAVAALSLLALLLSYVLVNRILKPVRRLTAEASGEQGAAAVTGNEINALRHSVQGLIKNVDLTQSELRRSRETLLQSEKMALVGKLAAGMAHSIRNPFTSVKMRLFSLGRSLELTRAQKEDFDVISYEIRHIDTIVQNFLEFSRPPKLQMQAVSPSSVVDSAIQLLGHRLRSYDVKLDIERQRPLPPVMADAEQLKEVLVNIIVNACEAMGKGGSITIREELDGVGQVVRLKISDNGPGIPEAIVEKVLQPFFTTKEQGTGLGLSIAARIMEEHGGWIDVDSVEGRGTTFSITLPIGGENL